MQEEYDSYLTTKSALKHENPGYDSQLEALKADLRTKLIAKMGSQREDILNEHLKYSKAFGISIGLTATLGCPLPPSILALTTALVTIFILWQGSGKGEQLVKSRHRESVVELISVL